MKKILIGCLALSMLTIVSCKKTAKVDGGTYTFKGTTYNVNSAIGNTTGDNTVVAISQPSNQYNELDVIFYSLIAAGAQVAPYPVAGSYTVVPGAPDTTLTQVTLKLTLTSGSTYNATKYVPSGNGTVTATVTAASGSNGVLTITLPAVDMVNVADPSDHSNLTATIKQTGVTQ